MAFDREAYNSAPVITGNKRVFFLNGDLVRKHHINRASGIMSVYNITKDRIESCLVADFKRNSEKAYTVKETAILVNRHQKYLPRLMKNGSIPFPTGAQKDGVREWRVRSYYSASQVKEIRDVLATFNMGRPRKDGLTNNNNTPTIQELNRRMGSGILTYTKTEDGNFVPLWTESI
jgi:hypothetical protein